MAEPKEDPFVEVIGPAGRIMVRTSQLRRYETTGYKRWEKASSPSQTAKTEEPQGGADS